MFEHFHFRGHLPPKSDIETRLNRHLSQSRLQVMGFLTATFLWDCLSTMCLVSLTAYTLICLAELCHEHFHMHVDRTAVAGHSTDRSGDQDV